MRHILTLSLFLLCLPLLAEDVYYEGALKAKPAAEMPLWSGEVPGEKDQNIGEEKAEPGKEPLPIVRVSNVFKPMLSVFQPAADKANGTCVVIFPGGGYSILAYNHEGTEIANWLNSLGVTAVVVKYRVPRRAGLPKHLAPLQDAQRAVRLVRKNAELWKVNPQRIGVLGFSAGAHLTLMAATAYDEKIYEPVDDTDKLSARPDFAAPIYLAYALGEKFDKNSADVPLDKEVKITDKTPPMFLSVCDDDPVGPMGSVQVYRALKENKVPCELHIFVKGGHGYGIRSDREPAAGWYRLCGDWLRSLELIPGTSKN
jgi:acetyl esterase/lipase